MKNISIGIIGTGNMGSALLRCMAKSNLVKSNSFWIYDKDIIKCKKLQQETGVNIANSAKRLTEKCNVIILAVKPFNVADVLSEIVNDLNPDQLIISIAAGISVNQIKQMIKQKCNVLRVMPNTPAMISEGMTAICYDPFISDEYLTLACDIFQSCGKVEIISENQIHGVTAISGSSPAYVFLFLEALADGGVMSGLSREQSYKMAAQTMIGAAKMLLQTEKHPGELKDMVCSPGGTTIDAIASLEKNGFRSAIIEAVRICAKRSKIMEKGNTEI